MNKRAILNRIDEKISNLRDSMETGLPQDKYHQKVGAIQEIKDLREFVVETSDDDDGDDGQLEELPL